MPPVTMTAGQLRDRVTWQQPSRTLTSTGKATTHADVLTTWACVDPTGGDEQTRHAQQDPQRTYLITLRSRTVDVKADWNAVWTNRGNLVLKVVSVLPHPNGGEFVLVTCVERAPTTASG
jgi:head-tail adaptor